MDNDKQIKFINDLKNVDIKHEEFIEQIRLFSQYLVYSNKDYNYNETYLENFCLEFMNFKKYVGIKNQVFGQIMKNLITCSQNVNLKLSIDMFWLYSSEVNEMSINKDINISKVCRENTLIKAKLMYGDKRFLFLKEYKVIEHEKILDKIIEQICNELLQWIEGINEKE